MPTQNTTTDTAPSGGHLKIAVLFGGTSEERDVSIASGTQVFRALREKGHQVIAIDTAKGLLTPSEEEALLHSQIHLTPPSHANLVQLRTQTAAILSNCSELRAVDIVFIVLHGGTGEDGTIQAFLDLLGIPYTGSGHIGSALAMDKDAAKHLLLAAQIPTPPWLMAPCSSTLVQERIGFPAVVKPSKQGSSVGLSIVKDPSDLQPAIDRALAFDDEVMIEKFIPGRELTVGVLENSALAVGEIIPKKSETFDYQSKYQPDGAEEIFPAPISAELTAKIQDLALRAHRALKLNDFSRIDFRLDAQNNPYCLELNTVPGMTTRSLLPQSALAAGIPFPTLCDRIAHLAHK